MKTNMQREIITIDDAKSFLGELFKNGESFHLDDNPFNCDIPNMEPFEGNQLVHLVEQVMKLDFDPYGYLLDLIEYKNLYILFGSEAVDIYEEEGFEALMEAIEEDNIRYELFDWESNPDPILLLVAHDGWDKYIIIKQYEYLELTL